MANRRNQPVEVEQNEEAVVQDVESNDDVPEAVIIPEVAVEAAPEEPEDVTRLVTIIPRRTVTQVRIGPEYYQFLQGKAVKVPVGVRAHCIEKGIC